MKAKYLYTRERENCFDRRIIVDNPINFYLETYVYQRGLDTNFVSCYCANVNTIIVPVDNPINFLLRGACLLETIIRNKSPFLRRKCYFRIDSVF